MRVLMIEDNEDDVLFLRESLRDIAGAAEVEWARSLAAGLLQLAKGGVDVVLLDLKLPDSDGLDTFADLHAHHPDLPVVVLTGCADETVALTAVQAGAPDYLVKGRINGHWLMQSLRYAVERQRAREALRTLSLVDELTGLLNRRAFLLSAEQQLKLSQRTRRGLWLLYGDLDGFKRINDTYGHPEGDRALRAVAAVLSASVRASDLVARLGGDEFVLLAVNARGEADTLAARVQHNLTCHAAGNALPYALDMSLGVARADPSTPQTVEDLLKVADRDLYRAKQSRAHDAAARRSHLFTPARPGLGVECPAT